MFLYSGSYGHYAGISRFIEPFYNQGVFFLASHLELSKSNPYKFIKLKTFPAFLNYEYYLSSNPSAIVKLKRAKLLYNIRLIEIRDLVLSIKPSIILIDSFNSTDIAIISQQFRSSKIKIALIQTKLSTILNYRSSYGGLASKNFAFVNSHHFIFKNWIKRTSNKIIFWGTDDYTFYNQLFKSLSFSKITIAWNRMGPPGINNLPEIVLSNEDMNNNKSDNQSFFGCMPIQNSISQCNTINPKIIVSLGSRNYKDDVSIKYIEIIRFSIVNLKDFTFFLPKKLSGYFLNKNIVYYNFEEYTKYLSQVDLHICHGGINSMIESLKVNIPLLMVPMDAKDDQIHSSLVFESLNLGLSFNISNHNKFDFLRKLEELLSQNYLTNLKRYNEKNQNNYSIPHRKSMWKELFKIDNEIRNL